MQKDGTPERTRTSDLVFRKHPLYPTELREHNGGDVLLASVGWGHGTVKVGQAGVAVGLQAVGNGVNCRCVLR